MQTESVLVQWGCSHPQAYGFHHPWIALGASPPISVKKLQNTVSPISFLWGAPRESQEPPTLKRVILPEIVIY